MLRHSWDSSGVRILQNKRGPAWAGPPNFWPIGGSGGAADFRPVALRLTCDRLPLDLLLVAAGMLANDDA